MANFEIKFLDAVDPETNFIKAEMMDFKTVQYVQLSGSQNGIEFTLWLDKSTAIKFAKTVRTEINKITLHENQNGER